MCKDITPFGLFAGGCYQELRRAGFVFRFGLFFRILGWQLLGRAKLKVFVFLDVQVDLTSRMRSGYSRPDRAEQLQIR